VGPDTLLVVIKIWVGYIITGEDSLTFAESRNRKVNAVKQAYPFLIILVDGVQE